MDITVAGRNEIKVAPERGTLLVRVEFESGDQADVLARATEVVRRIQAAVEGVKGRAPQAVTTVVVPQIATSAWRPYGQDGQPQAMRYSASDTLRIEFVDFHELSAFAGEIGTTEGVTLAGVEWELTDETKATKRAEVLTGAVQDARRRAAVLAEAAGAGAVEVVEIADPGMLSGVLRMDGGAMGSPRAYLASAGFAGGSQGLELAPADLDIDVEVHVRFRAS